MADTFPKFDCTQDVVAMAFVLTLFDNNAELINGCEVKVVTPLMVFVFVAVPILMEPEV